MKYSSEKTAQSLTEILVSKQIDHIVISPGSRNAPLTTTFYSHPAVKPYSVVDERSAAFVALGMIQKIKKPVVACCTSGSALLNYYPAVSEAFYQNKPLIIISADRPKEKIDQSFGQTVRQENVFKNHIGFSANLVEDSSEKGLRYNERLINEALNIAVQKQLPVHINIPFSEPFYGLEKFISVSPKIIQHSSFDKILNVNELENFSKIWNCSKQKMVLIGQLPKTTLFQEQIDHLLKDPSVIILHETTSNIYHKKAINSIDKIIFSLSDADFERIKPEILITVEKNIISKKIKNFLEKYPAKYHANINFNGDVIDTFSSLTHNFETTPELFFSQFFYLTKFISSDYQDIWLNLKQEKQKKHTAFLTQCEFSDLKVFETILKQLPSDIDLHLSNSSIVRYAQLFDINSTIEHYCNRGTSGIDGSMSTAIGSAMMTSKQTVFITGDISFFYDSNALWNSYTPQNFVIILINNGGGEIFKFIPGPDKTDALKQYFVTEHSLTAQYLAQMHGYHYAKVNHLEDLQKQLPAVFLSNQPTLLEIDTRKVENATILKNYFQFLQ
ncbi:MAG: 2-succinyl-5-enolpyruvyl-6-hydroxy-3-cyclohexene-1-carboxylic-acid synthase [Flavobacteriales bacterium]